MPMYVRQPANVKFLGLLFWIDALSITLELHTPQVQGFFEVPVDDLCHARAL